MHLPASPLMHGTGGFTLVPGDVASGSGIVTLENRHFDAHELWQTVQRERVTQMAIVGDAFAKPMVRALEEAEAKGTPYDLSSLQLIISSGVMWSPETKQALMARGNMICFDSLGSSEGVGFAGSIDAPGSAPTTAKFTIGASTKVFTDDGREVEPGSDEIGMLAVGGHIPVGYYKDERKSEATFREINGERWSVPGDFARVEADGTIVLLGRGSVVINSGGEKVFPEEVEEAVKAHPDGHRLPGGGRSRRPLRRSRHRDRRVPRRGDRHRERPHRRARVARALQAAAPSSCSCPRSMRGPNGKADYKWAKAAGAADETAE